MLRRESPPSRSGPQPSGEGQLHKLGIGLFSQAAVITAILYYFGWARTQGAFTFFGLDPEIVNLSVADYVLRSVRPLLEPVLIVLMAALICINVHTAVVVPYLSLPNCAKVRVRQVLLVAEFLSCLALAAALVVPSEVSSLAFHANLAVPVIFAVAPLLLAYCNMCRMRFQLQSVASRRRRGPFATSLSYRRTLYVVSACGAFWVISVYASDSGQVAAEDLSQNLVTQPDVVVYSTQRLAISGTGVNVQEIKQPDSKFKYEYTGLRLLIKADNHYVLLPVAWRAGFDSAIDIAEDDSTRFDIRSPGH